jgi:hypothetical protein
MVRRGIWAYAGLVAVSLVLSGCGLLPRRAAARHGVLAKPVPSNMCELVDAKTRDLLVPDGEATGSGGGSPEADSTVGGGCEVRSPGIGGPNLQFSALRFPVGGAKRYSGFPTAAQTYDSCTKQMLVPYNPDSAQLREHFPVDFGDKATGAYGSNQSSNGRPVIDSADVCVLAGNDEIQAEYHTGGAEQAAPKESLKQGATLAAASVLRNLP